MLLDPIRIPNLRAIAAISSAACALFLCDPQVSHGLGPGYTAIDATMAASEQPQPQTQTQLERIRLKSCSANSNCVSSNYLEPPNRYIPPLKIVKDRDTSFQRAVRDLQREATRRDSDKSTATAASSSNLDIVEIIPKEYYIHLTVPGTSPGSLDDLEIVFPMDGNIVHVRCEARVTLPPPPFCVTKNCINGNMDQRRRVEDVSNRVMGLPPSITLQGAKWTPIFFNADRVPDMIDEYDDLY